MQPKPILLNVGGLSCSVQLNNQRYTDSFNQYFANFLTEERPEMSLEAELVKSPLLKEKFTGQLALDLSRIKAEGDMVFFESPSGEGSFDRRLKAGRGVFHTFEAFRNFVRVCYALALLEKKAVVLHSSGIIHEGRSILFSGPSGAGKSTIMKLSSFPRLNEEANVVKLENGSLSVQSTPFGGWEMPNLVNPLKNIFFIEKSDRTFTQPLDEVEKFSQLMCNEFLSMSLIFSEAPKLVTEIFSLLYEMTPFISAKRLFFEKNDHFVKLF